MGLSGRDDQLIQAEKMVIERPGAGERRPEIIDLGLVGRVRQVNTDLIDRLDRFIPVIAPVGIDGQGRSLNINADLVAGRVAAALGAEKLILLTDVTGVLDKEGALLSTLTVAEVKALMADRTISGGMIPKADCCLEALAQGVAKTHIIDGRQPHAVLLEVFTREGIGTQIVGEV